MFSFPKCAVRLHRDSAIFPVTAPSSQDGAIMGQNNVQTAIYAFYPLFCCNHKLLDRRYKDMINKISYY